jgi:GTPase SAR1 family protein
LWNYLHSVLAKISKTFRVLLFLLHPLIFEFFLVLFCFTASVHDVTPTIGYSSVKINFENYEITLYDLGGGPKIRDIWCNYYAEVYGFVFVIDSSNESRMEECQNVLKALLQNKFVCGKPVLL